MANSTSVAARVASSYRQIQLIKSSWQSDGENDNKQKTNKQERMNRVRFVPSRIVRRVIQTGFAEKEMCT